MKLNKLSKQEGTWDEFLTFIDKALSSTLRQENAFVRLVERICNIKILYVSSRSFKRLSLFLGSL